MGKDLKDVAVVGGYFPVGTLSIEVLGFKLFP
jgi:hypothetical protein